jgi:hypothetical protein
MLVNMTTPLFVVYVSPQRFRRFKAPEENLIQMVNEAWSGRAADLINRAAASRRVPPTPRAGGKNIVRAISCVIEPK